ncbi:MAG: hypothetical protein JST68_07170 [Bacteroidetes bacterium]|nr:hypothetical protein [Bacteroidota bacterium]
MRKKLIKFTKTFAAAAHNGADAHNGAAVLNDADAQCIPPKSQSNEI